jgi:hypothetical protein
VPFVIAAVVIAWRAPSGPNSAIDTGRRRVRFDLHQADREKTNSAGAPTLGQNTLMA